jgi:chromosome segregation ATPase
MQKSGNDVNEYSNMKYSHKISPENFNKSISQGKETHPKTEKMQYKNKQRYVEWEKIININEQLTTVNNESAELIKNLEKKNILFGELSKQMAGMNLESAELVIEIEQMNQSLLEVNNQISRANAHAAELMAILEIKDEKILKLNSSLSKANARSAELIADREMKIEEINRLNQILKVQGKK